MHRRIVFDEAICGFAQYVCKDYAEDNIEGGKSLLVISNGRAKFRPA